MRLALLVPLCLVCLRAQTPEQVFERLAEREGWRDAALRDYQALRRYTVSGARFAERAEMEVRVDYSHPGAKRFQVLRESGSGFLRSRVFKKAIEAELEAAREGKRERARIDAKNYDFSLAGMQTLDGRPAYVVNLRPRARSKFLIEGRIWVDVEDAAIVRLEGTPASRVSFWVKNLRIVQTYRKIGSFWLAHSSEMRAEMRLFGPASLNIRHYDYQVNRSLLAQRRAR